MIHVNDGIVSCADQQMIQIKLDGIVSCAYQQLIQIKLEFY